MLGGNFSAWSAHIGFAKTKTDRQLAQSRLSGQICKNVVERHIETDELKRAGSVNPDGRSRGYSAGPFRVKRLFAFRSGKWSAVHWDFFDLVQADREVVALPE